jgi:hypothetical protein
VARFSESVGRYGDCDLGCNRHGGVSQGLSLFVRRLVIPVDSAIDDGVRDSLHVLARGILNRVPDRFDRRKRSQLSARLDVFDELASGRCYALRQLGCVAIHVRGFVADSLAKAARKLPRRLTKARTLFVWESLRNLFRNLLRS